MFQYATRVAIAVALALGAGGCSTVVNTGAGELAGIAGAAIAGAVTQNPGVAAGIGLGAQAGARAGVHYWQREVHRASQERIADAAGPLDVGQVATWQTEHRAPLERGEQGRVTVSRLVSTTLLECKEVVFSVDDADEEGTPRSAFYVAMLCRDGARWRWASAEPSTQRWGGLQ
ncbi:MAG TPA: hypothetical protein VED01_12910 [Burkholderiales bacterium]|nr:hypothetical protein [Burkholderiales bacterium]